MSVIRIIISGDPKGKGRPQFRRMHGRGVIAFTPPETRAYEERVMHLAKRAMAGRLPIKGPIAVTVYAVFRIPRTATKDRSAKMLSGAIHPRKIDIDNIVKACLDGAQGIVFENDADVVSLTALKRYGECPRVQMIVQPLTDEAIAALMQASDSEAEAA